ncbi:capsule polysaccharide transporter [termite gut metagenome]|uniref:Capsule polysaccharide transporter n=1 Tax=termite gut metagenome TaxID=433724 RepID=A0A5J4RPR6_9ZZZZ
MRRLITLLFIIIFLSEVAVAQRMSDNEVIEYVKDANSKGKNKNQIMAELRMRGVTRQQVEKIQKQYANTQDADITTTNKSPSSSVTTKKLKYQNRNQNQNQQDDLSSETIESSVVAPLFSLKDSLKDSLSVLMPSPSKDIFGHDIFTNQYLTFEPNNNLATPNNYILGPGDEVIINVWGASETSIDAIISPQGNIQVEGFGPIYLSGLTIKEANSYLQREFGKIYSGLSGNVSQVKLTLGELRTIQINIMGEVLVPGTYRLSSFSSVFHALYSAGGVTERGSLRNVQVMRKGKNLTNIDVYKYIFEGKINDDIRLMEEDVIIVPTYDCLVKVSGKVKRPMYYEIKKDETIDALLSYAGGFTGNAYRKNIQLTRFSNGREKQIYIIEEEDYSVFKLHDEDDLTIQEILDRYENKVTIRGAVYREGIYAINEKITTVKQLIEKAEGLRGDAFLGRAQLQREHEDLTFEIISIDIKKIINNTAADIPLLRNDELYIPSIHDLHEEETLTIHGEISSPGIYDYTDNTTIEDLIIKAGGLLDAASLARVDVTRRIKDPQKKTFTSTIGKMFSFEIKNGLLITKTDNNFILQPYDEVYVRKSPGYSQQQNVSITGEILFSGSYALTKKNERLSNLINQAGGITPDAYVKGSRLFRQMTEQEKHQKTDIMRIVSQTDTLKKDIQLIENSDVYTVGIDLEKALQQPGSNYDLILREGDKIHIPEYVNTIKINGAVMRANTVLYNKGKNLKYYIEQAGGYSEFARKSRVYVVYTNGTVARIKNNTAKKIEPGCEIIVPSKSEERKMTIMEYVTIGTSFASLSTMLATIISILK